MSTQNSTRRRALIPLGLLTLAVILVLAVGWIVRVSLPLPDSALRAQTQQLMDNVLRGDGTALARLVDSRNAATITLTPGAARVAMGEHPSYSIQDVDLGSVPSLRRKSTRAVVRGTLVTAAGEVPFPITWTRRSKDDPWEVQRVAFPTLDVTPPFEQRTVNVNGVGLTLAPYGNTSLVIWPGLVEITGPLLTPVRLTTMGVTTRRPGLLGADDAQPRLSATLALNPSLTGDTAMRAAATTLLQRCTRAGQTPSGDCPFVPPTPPGQASGVRNIVFSDPSLDETDGLSSADARSWLLRGTVRAKGQWLVGGRWEDFSSRVPFAATVTRSLTDDGVRLSMDPERSSSVARSWSDALTDHGSVGRD